MVQANEKTTSGQHKKLRKKEKKRKKKYNCFSSYWTVEAESVAAAILVKFATAHAVIVIPTYNIIVQNTVFDRVKGTISPKPIVTIVITAQYIDLQYLYLCKREKEKREEIEGKHRKKNKERRIRKVRLHTMKETNKQIVCYVLVVSCIPFIPNYTQDPFSK